MLVAVRRYKRVKNAQEMILKMIERKDDKIKDLESLEVDMDLLENKVCILFVIEIYNLNFFCTAAAQTATIHFWNSNTVLLTNSMMRGLKRAISHLCTSYSLMRKVIFSFSLLLSSDISELLTMTLCICISQFCTLASL